MFCRTARFSTTSTLKAQAILPDLRAEYEKVMLELEQEQADVSEIENCDQDYLNELKTSIAEQKLVNILAVVSPFT